MHSMPHVALGTKRCSSVPTSTAKNITLPGDTPPKSVGELIDEVERIREDLLRLQRELEKLEIVNGIVNGEREEA